MPGDAGQDRVVLINFADNQCMDWRWQGLSRQRVPHTTNLMQCREARLDGCNDMRLHGVVAVDMDAKDADRQDQLNCDAVDTDMPSWDLMLTSL